MVISKLIKLPKHVAGLIGRLLGVAAAATDWVHASKRRPVLPITPAQIQLLLLLLLITCILEQ